jgi:hypothetical protein
MVGEERIIGSANSMPDQRLRPAEINLVIAWSAMTYITIPQGEQDPGFGLDSGSVFPTRHPASISLSFRHPQPKDDKRLSSGQTSPNELPTPRSVATLLVAGFYRSARGEESEGREGWGLGCSSHAQDWSLR